MSVVYFTLTMILTKELVVATEQCGVYRFKSPFYPGQSCEDIYTKNPESREKSGYYWITDGPTKVYCGMNYTASSCDDIFFNNPVSGYYRINANWTYCDMAIMTSCYAGNASAENGWRRIINFDITVGDACPVDGVQIPILVIPSAVRSVTLVVLALLSVYPLMEQVTRGCVVEQEDIRRE